MLQGVSDDDLCAFTVGAGLQPMCILKLIACMHMTKCEDKVMYCFVNVECKGRGVLIGKASYMCVCTLWFAFTEKRGRASLVLPIPAQGRLNLLRGPDVAQHLLLCSPLCNKRERVVVGGCSMLASASGKRCSLD